VTVRSAIVILILLFVAVLCVNAVVTDAETKPAKADIGQIVELDGPDLQVRDEGPKDAPAIVLVHCYDCSMHWWQPVAHHLARDHRVVSVDLIGHGGSEKPTSGYEIENQAKQVWAALDAVGVKNAVLAGHSLGGMVVTAMTEQSPERVDGLVAVGSPPAKFKSNLPLTAQIGYVPVIGEAILRVVPDSMVEQGLSTAFAPGYDLPDFALPDYRRMTYSSYDKAGAAGSTYAGEKSVPERIGDLGIRVLYIQGDRDQLVDTEFATEGWGSIKGAQVEVLPGIGHSPSIEAPQKTAELIDKFAVEAQKKR
jgi:pimeloyl-ACP methyl ester carboxylesterase